MLGHPVIAEDRNILGMTKMVEKRIFHSVAEQICDLIQKGVFPRGARLPSERELAQRFGVSRVTIRDAEIALQAIGRLEIKASSGVYVSDDAPENLASIMDINAFELIEARLLFESEAAALAAVNITDDELKILDHLIRQMAMQDIVLAAEADQQFHLMIARASDNRAILFTIETLWHMRDQVPELQSLYEIVCESDADLRAKEHRTILHALQARDPIATRNAMRAHFNRLLSAMLEVTEQQALEDLRQRALESRTRFLAPARAA